MDLVVRSREKSAQTARYGPLYLLIGSNTPQVTHRHTFDTRFSPSTQPVSHFRTRFCTRQTQPQIIANTGSLPRSHNTPTYTIRDLRGVDGNGGASNPISEHPHNASIADPEDDYRNSRPLVFSIVSGVYSQFCVNVYLVQFLCCLVAKSESTFIYKTFELLQSLL